MSFTPFVFILLEKHNQDVNSATTFKMNKYVLDFFYVIVSGSCCIFTRVKDFETYLKISIFGGGMNNAHTY
ncbi:hypothetical protein BKC07_00805 [Peribacillus simplex]|nr:hypothetical protein BKC07_00805 [Peribacillus simplex]